MNIKAFIFPLIMLFAGCYHNPFLADTYAEKTQPVIIHEKKASYKISYYQQTKDLKSYELKDEETAENLVGTTITATAKAFTGFTFDNTNSENITSGVVTENETLVLKLYYNRNKYTVTFDKNSETATGEMQAQTFYYDVSNPLSTNSFTYIEHVFIGWAKTPDTTQNDFEDSQSISNLSSENNGNVTLYAVWLKGEPINYTIENYLQTKDLSSYKKSDNPKTLQSVDGKKVTATPDSIEGFTFDEANSENITSGVVTENETLVLKLYYNRNKYTVTFDKNSETATGEMQAQTFYYGIDKDLILKDCCFTDEYHAFIGWAKTAEATKADFENKATLSFDLSTKSSEITLYAIWGKAPAANITSLACKITGNEENLEDKSVISTSRSITVSFSAENAVKTSYSLENETKEAENADKGDLDFPDLTDGDYTFKVWAENIDGVKSEERTFSWTMACSPKLKIEGIPDSIIKIDTEVNINVSGDNLESCSYSLNDGDSKEITLTDNAGKFTIKNNTAGDFTLTITGKNKLDETTEETFNWTVVETPVAKLSEVTDFMPIGCSTQTITVSGCDYYMYKIGDEDWSKVFQVSEQISIENIANDINTYNIYVVGGNSGTYSDVDWQSKETPTTTSWKVYPVYNGESLDSVLADKNDVSKPGVDGKNIYASYDDNFVYFGYESQTAENFTEGKKALCIAMKSTGKDRYGIKPVDYIDETEDNSQPTFSLNSESLTHFLKVTFDTKTTGTTKFFRVSEERHWVETASEGIPFEIKEEGKCVLAIPRMLLAAPDAEVKYVVYMRNYTSKSIYAIYPEASEYRENNKANVYTSKMDIMDLTSSSD